MSFKGALQLLLDFSRPSSFAVQHPANVESGLHEKRIAGFLSMLLPDSVDVCLTDNRTTLISSSLKGGRRVVRLHRMFRNADDRLLRAIGVFLMGSATAAVSRCIDEFIAAHRDEIRSRPTRGRRLRAVSTGEHYNLEEVLARVKTRYFADAEGVTIGWARAGHRSRRRRRSGRVSRALATYCYEDASIRVNPILDSRRVPQCVMDWVVYHEMLHHVLPVRRTNGRSRYHTAEFRALERSFPDYEKVRDWEKENINWLVR